MSLKPFAGMKIFLQTRDAIDFSAYSSNISVPFALISRSNLAELTPCPKSEQQEAYVAAYTLILQNKYLVGWYGTNKVVQHPKLIALPLGPKWQWASVSFHGENVRKARVSKLLSHYGLNVMHNFYGKKRQDLLYVSMTKGSSDLSHYAPWRGSRRKAAQVARENIPVAKETIKFEDIHTLSHAKGCEDMEAFEKQLIRLQHYKFVLSPPGLAPDAHRPGRHS